MLLKVPIMAEFLDKVVDIIDNFLEPDKEEVSDNISNDVNEATPKLKKSLSKPSSEMLIRYLIIQTVFLKIIK